MEMPVLTAEHKKLEKIIGSWMGEETLYPSPFNPSGGKAIGRVVNRKALAGFAVIQDYEEEREGVINFQGHGVFRWDAARSAYTFHWFDSIGMPPNEYSGQMDGDVLTMINKAEHGYTRATFDFSQDGRYRFVMEVSGDGQQWHKMMEGDYTRKG